MYWCYVYQDRDDKDAALKCFAAIGGSKVQDIPVQELARIYADMRVEVNKLSTVDHPNIVQFLGLCIVSFSILLEWAPKGNLNQIIDKYLQADMWICPDTVARTIFQVPVFRYIC